MPTYKVTTLAAAGTYLEYFLSAMGNAIDFYGLKKWRRLRWKTEIATQKTIDAMCKTIRGDTAVPRAISFGNGNVNMARGRPKVPVKRLFKSLRKLYGRYVRKMSERYSSQMCSLCDGWFGDNQRIYSVRTCKSVCLVRPHLDRSILTLAQMVWNRDVNAARNMRHIFIHMEENAGERPEAFRG
jgi:hypothetical protein